MPVRSTYARPITHMPLHSHVYRSNHGKTPPRTGMPDKPNIHNAYTQEADKIAPEHSEPNEEWVPTGLVWQAVSHAHKHVDTDQQSQRVRDSPDKRG